MQIQQESLTDAQSAVILGIIGDNRTRKYDLKVIVEAIFWINRTGTEVKTVKKVLADAAYKGQFTIHVQANEYEIEIASRPPSERGFVPVKKRWVVERTFSWFNSFRRLDKDHEKTVQSAENMIYIAQIQILLNRNYR
jgi:transposase